MVDNMWEISVINIGLLIMTCVFIIIMIQVFEINNKALIIILVIAICRMGFYGLILLETYDSHKELQQISYKYSNELVCKNGILGLVKTEQSRSLYSWQNRDIVAYKKQEFDNKFHFLFGDDKDYYNILYFVPVSVNGCNEYNVNKNIKSLLNTINNRYSGYRILTN